MIANLNVFVGCGLRAFRNLNDEKLSATPSLMLSIKINRYIIFDIQ